MAKGDRSVKILQGLFLLLTLYLGFVYINNPFQEVKELSQLVLFFVVSASFFFIILLTSPSLMRIELESASEFFDEYVTGSAIGLFINVFVVALALFLAVLFGLASGAAASVSFESVWAASQQGVVNFTGSISALSVQTMTDDALFFLVHIMPFVETIILVGITLVGGAFLKGTFAKLKLRGSYLAAGLAAALIFGVFHFAAVSGGSFEYSGTGFLQFVASLDGALIHFSFGLLSVLLFLAFDSFVVVYGVHHVNNLLFAVSTLGFTPLVVTIVAIDVGIALIALWRVKFMKYKEVKFSRIFV